MFLHVGADHTRARKIFLGAGRNVREHRLNAFKALMNAASEVLNDDAGNGQRQKGVDREFRADGEHEAQGAGGEHKSIRRGHDGGAKQHSDGVQVVRGAGHDVARTVALIVGVGEAFEVCE